MSLEHSKISKRVGVIGFFTLISRILGLGRDMALAYAFGATMFADAFYVAFRIPNLLRRLVAEGSLTIAFVPIYTEYLHKSRKNAYDVACVVFTFLSMVLVGIVLLGVLFAPWIVKLVALGFEDTPEKYQLTVILTRIMFPYIFLISLVALAMGILNSLKRFAAPAAAPILLNIAIIFGALFLKNYFVEPTTAVAIGVLIGGVLQLSLQIPFLIKEGMLPHFKFQPKHPALKKLLLMMIPSAYGAAVYQVNVLVITFLASFLAHGSVSYLWYADRISEFPLGIFAIAVATATLPTLSDHAVAKDVKAFRDTTNFALRLVFLIDIPAAIGLFILAEPIVRVLFQRGVFDVQATLATAGTLKMFALGIPFVSGVRNLVPAFFALRSPKTPVIIATVALVVNAVMALLLMQTMLYRGLALAMALASSINFALLIIFLRRKIGRLGARKIIASVGRSILASSLMGGFIISAIKFGNLFTSKQLASQVLSLTLLIMISIMLYIAIIRFISFEEYQAIKRMVKRGKQ
ncbi:MAG: murein biosynthesis integral membrane protein MurJ [Pseudomonadota bacterium]